MKFPVQERYGNNTPTVAYTRGQDLSGSLEGAGGIGGLLGRSHGWYSGGTYTTHNHYHADAVGNITYLVNSGQTAEATYRYDPYGRTMTQSGTLAAANVYRFSSKEIHAQSGMYYYGVRFYEPHLQRWLNGDPLPELGHIMLRRAGITSQRLALKTENTYRFCGNSPVRYFDAFGLVSEEDCKAQLDADMVAVARASAKCAAKAAVGGVIGAFATVIGGGVGFIVAGPPGAAIGGGGVFVIAVVSDWCTYNSCIKKANKMADDAKQRYETCMKQVTN